MVKKKEEIKKIISGIDFNNLRLEQSSDPASLNSFK